MNTVYVLVLTVLQFGDFTVTTGPTFTSKATCNAWGQAWQAQVYAEQRERPSRVVGFECSKQKKEAF